MEISEAREFMGGIFKEMKNGEEVVFGVNYRRAAFPAESVFSALAGAMAGNRPQTPSDVQEERFMSAYDVKIVAVDPFSGNVTYEKKAKGEE